MSTEYFELGCTPSNEDCVQVDSHVDYMPAMREELNRYKTMLQKRFPIPEKVDAWFSVKWFSHDFGRYGEVAICFNDRDDSSCHFACFVEDNTPQNWNDDSVLTFVPENDKPSLSDPFLKFAEGYLKNIPNGAK